MVDTYIMATQGKVAELKEPASKAGELPEDVLATLWERLVKPEMKGRYELAVVRTLLRVTVVRYTLCCFNCYDKLRACDIEDWGDSVRITVTSAKNDQMHEGSVNCILNEDKDFFRFAFRQLGFKIKKPGDKSYFNCVVHRRKGQCSLATAGSPTHMLQRC
jgi:hypothetical protein